MANMDDQDLIYVYENGKDGDGYNYKLNIDTGPATIVVTKLGTTESESINISDEEDNDDDEFCASKSKKLKTSNNSNSKDGFEQFNVVTGDDENFCMEGSDIEGEMEEPELRSVPPSDTQQAEANLGTGISSRGDADWTQTLDDFLVIPPFTGEPGLHIDTDTDESNSALSCFKLFFTDWLFKQIQEQTNKYAQDLIVVHTDELDKQGHNVLKDWKPVSLPEIKGFILILIHMGVVKKPLMDHYWSVDVFTSSVFAGQILSSRRFRAIFNMFHMNDNHTYIPVSQPNHDPLHKVRPIYEHLQKRFQEIYTPDKNLAINEPLLCMSSNGCGPDCLNFKPNPCGFKMYQLCECSTGYVYRFELFGSETGLSSSRPTDIALRLIEPLLDKGYNVYTDSKYTCPVFYDALTNRKTMCTGVVNKDRQGIPQDLVQEKLVTGQIAFRRRDKLCTVKWNSTEKTQNNIMILTSSHHPLMTSTTDANKNNNTTVTTKVKPVCVSDFTKNMQALLDYNEQITSYIPIAQQAMKWSKKVFLYLLTLSIHQAMVVYNKRKDENRGKHLNLHQFFKALGKQLTDEYISERGQGLSNSRGPQVPPVYKTNSLIRFDHTLFHHLEQLPRVPGSSRRSYRVCGVCKEVKKRKRITSDVMGNQRVKEVSNWCKVCEIPLCTEPCFYIYHNHPDYITVACNL